MFALLFWRPIFPCLGFVRSAGKGAVTFYNLVHTTFSRWRSACLHGTGASMLAGQLALIWLAHISFDRCLGFGLKFPSDFRFTHIESAANLNHAPVLK